MSDEIELKIQETVRRQALEDAAGLESAATAFPGPLRDVFALDPDITVGMYRVRPCFDYDLRVLAQLNHPAYNLLLRGDEKSDFLPIGPEAAILAWMFTQPVQQLKAAMEHDGPAKCQKQADEMFEFVQPRVLGLLVQAVARQITVSTNARLEYGPAVEEKKAEEANAAAPPLPKSQAA
jgi:hypothetical protein